jgi:hypothetical protein
VPFNLLLAVLGSCAMGDFVVTLVMVWDSISLVERAHNQD